MDAPDIRRRWAERTGEFSPEYYAYRGANEASEAVRRALDRHVGTDASVLELGCSSGRHLANLRENGYRDLSGIEVNGDALEVMGDEYPDLAAAGTFYLDAIEDRVPEFADDRFDAVYSVETLQHIHPDAAAVFADIARVTGSVLVTAEIEGDEGDDSPDVSHVTDDIPLYYRDWGAVFTGVGLVQASCEGAGRDTVRVFRPPE